MLSVIDGSLATSGLFAALLLSHWTIKVFELNKAAIPARVEPPRYKQTA